MIRLYVYVTPVLFIVILLAKNVGINIDSSAACNTGMTPTCKMEMFQAGGLITYHTSLSEGRCVLRASLPCDVPCQTGKASCPSKAGFASLSGNVLPLVQSLQWAVLNPLFCVTRCQVPWLFVLPRISGSLSHVPPPYVRSPRLTAVLLSPYPLAS